MSKAEQVAAAAFVWGSLATTEPPSQLDQRIVREARSDRPVIAIPAPPARRGDNRGSR